MWIANYKNIKIQVEETFIIHTVYRGLICTWKRQTTQKKNGQKNE